MADPTSSRPPTGDRSLHDVRIALDGDVSGQAAVGDGNVQIQVNIQQAARGGTSLHQLRAPLPDFVGREAELAALEEAIASGGAVGAGVFPPPVGLRGMGGIGKTELALVLAHRLTPRYPDAQFFLDLRGTSRGGVFPPPLTAAEAMAHVIRAYHPELRLPENEGELTGMYHSVLHGQRALLLMDNAADRAQVEPLLCPDSCLLLVTSRTHFTLPGLVALNLDALPLEEAVELLFRIAPRLRPQKGPPLNPTRELYGGGTPF